MCGIRAPCAIALITICQTIESASGGASGLLFGGHPFRLEASCALPQLDG